MFGFVKKLLGKKTDERDEGAKELPAASSKPSAPAVTVSARTGGAPAPAAGAGAASGALKTAPTAHATGSASGGGKVQVSLLGIVSLLPTELKPARAVGDMASVQILFAERPLLEQLSQGCIRVPFSEVRKLAPEGFFTAGSEFDQKLVELPLQEVLPQLHGKALGRRASQKTTHVPEEVTSLFSARGNLVAPPPSSATARSAAAQPGNPPSPSATPSPGAASSAGHTSHTTRPAASGSGNTAHTTRTSPTGASRPPGPLKPRPAAPPGQPGATGDATQNVQAKAAEVARNAPVAFRPPEPPPAAPEAAAPAVEPPPPVSKPIAAPNLMAAMKGGAAGATPKRSETPSTPVSAPISAGASLPKGLGLAAGPAAAAAAGAGETVIFQIGQLAGAWPDPVKQDIARWNLDAASIALPAEEIGAALKQGRVRCTWSRLLGALSPDPRGDKQSAVGDTELDLPLAVVAPAFLGRQRSGSAAGGSARPGGSALSDIPDLFHAGKATGAPAPAATPPSTQATGDTARFRKAAPTAPVPAPVPAAPPTQPASIPATAPQTIGVPLAMIDESWPDALKAEISRAQVPGVKMELPVEDIDRSLKSGKIEYTWRQLRSWLKPALPGEVGAEHADRLLTLPLKVIAPLFLGQVKPIQARRKVDPNSDIPDLFSGGAGPAPGSEAHTKEAAPALAAAAVKPAEPAPAVGPELAGSSTFSTTQFFRKPPADLGELFGQPGKRNWTPNDIVQNTCRIRGVAGAVIAMQDGLLVAGQMPSPWKAEATAAFLPQIYSRLNQYLKELSVSELSSVTLNTANGTLFVFNAGIIYFAVVGKPEETLPLAPIKLIVSELSRHTK